MLKSNPPSDFGPPSAPWRPCAIDTRAVMPMLRAQASETAIEFLAYATVFNTLEAARWMALTWGPDSDFGNPAHPYWIASQDPSTPAWRATAAQDALSTACWRYRLATGRDGLALAREVIVSTHGAEIAEYALAPLLRVAAGNAELARLGFDIDAELASDAAPLPPEPDPTPEQRQRATQAICEWAFSDPAMAGLGSRLAALLAAYQASDGGQHTPAVAAALEGVRAELQSAADGGVEREPMQALLDAWSTAMGAPRVSVRALAAG